MGPIQQQWQQYANHTAAIRLQPEYARVEEKIAFYAGAVSALELMQQSAITGGQPAAEVMIQGIRAEVDLLMRLAAGSSSKAM